MGPLLGGLGKRGEKSRLTLAKIVRGIATGEVRKYCEEREKKVAVGFLLDLHCLALAYFHLQQLRSCSTYADAPRYHVCRHCKPRWLHLSPSRIPGRLLVSTQRHQTLWQTLTWSCLRLACRWWLQHRCRCLALLRLWRHLQAVRCWGSRCPSRFHRYAVLSACMLHALPSWHGSAALIQVLAVQRTTVAAASLTPRSSSIAGSDLDGTVFPPPVMASGLSADSLDLSLRCSASAAPVQEHIHSAASEAQALTQEAAQLKAQAQSYQASQRL